jgi:FAD:protein FMN transferase
MSDRPQTAVLRMTALGTEAVMALADPARRGAAETVLRDELEAIDRACSRFRPDAELATLHERAGEWTRVSPLLFEALDTARRVARWTDGAVDPTVGTALALLGYDRDFAAVASSGAPTPAPQPAPGWRVLELDARRRLARVPTGVRLDLGATAKALVADRIAGAVAALGTGTVVSIGGDVSIAGRAPRTGWSIGVAADSSSSEDVEQVVAMTSGGLATSSTDVRSWRRGARRVHHIVDPRTGDSALAVWRMATTAAPTCVEANAASTAAVVWGVEAPDRLESMGLAARLVRSDGVVVTTAGWPRPDSAEADRHPVGVATASAPGWP